MTVVYEKGLTHMLIGDEYDVTTGERNDYFPDRCDQCNRPYTKARKDQRFCSRACGLKWHHAHPKPKAPKQKQLATVTDLAVTATPTVASAVDVAGLVGQLLAAADYWNVEATIGDITINVQRRGNQ